MAAERPVGKATASKVLRPFPVTPHRYVVGMKPGVYQGLLNRAGEWDDLRRWEGVTRMRAEAQDNASTHLDDPFFVAGVALDWGERSKRHADLALANSDPAHSDSSSRGHGRSTRRTRISTRRW